MPDIRYQITHDPALIDAYHEVAADIMCNEMGLAYLPGFRERAMRVGFTFPMVALDGDEVVAGVTPVLRHPGNADILLPEEHGTDSRLLGCHPRLARRFAWSNYAVVHPRYRRTGVFEELSCHVFAIGSLFAADAIGVTCMPEAVPGYIQLARKYGMHAGAVDVDFVLPEQYRSVGVVFFLISPQTAVLPEHTVARLRTHCERAGIPVPP